MKAYEGVVLSGGSIRGVAMLGALDLFDEHNTIDDVKVYSGSSVGAIIVLLLSVSYKPKEIFEILRVINLQDINKVDIWKLFNEYGLNSASQLLGYIKNALRGKSIPIDITFKRLFELTSKVLVITGTCVNKHTIEYFDYQKTPDMTVIEAVRISISIPLLFVSPVHNTFRYVDGGLLDNFPLYGIKNHIHSSESHILAIQLRNLWDLDAPAIIDSFETFSVHLLCTLMDEVHRLRQQLVNANSETMDTLYIDTESTSSLRIEITNEEKESLYNIGKHLAARYIENKMEQEWEKKIEQQQSIENCECLNEK